MHIWSTCSACNTVLQVSELGQQLHDTCHNTHPTGDPLVDAFLAAALTGDDVTADQLQVAIEAEDQRARLLMPAALTYADWGWPVFPLQPESKEPYERSRGFKDATTDPELIRRWWTKAPESNIGLATGHLFDVLDVDFVTKDTKKPTGAQQSWPDLRDSGQLPDIHGIATTPRGGLHIYLSRTGGGNKAGFLPGLDYRGIGGYVVAAPSRAPGGRRYTWWHRPSPTLTSGSSQVPSAA
jgi:hypothetical protein